MRSAQSSKYLQSPNPASSAHRRGHAPQISISDDSHHVTEAIGGMYGDNEWTRRDPRPLSFAPSHSEAQLERKASKFSSSSNSSSNDTPLSKSFSNERPANSSNGSFREKRRAPSISSTATDSPTSPSLTRSPSTDTANQAFPLNDIDYESSPAAVAQELSNLQAIRRMSMNVDAADPDLPSFNSGSIGMPSVAPKATADENDASRLFWVPARLHPELSPKDYKSFVEDRVDRIKKTSSGNDEESGSLSPNSVERTGSAASNPNRRRSMLSKAVEIPSDFKDGADVLERKRSDHKRTPSVETSLQELETLVNDPSSLVRKMSLDAHRRSMDSNPESPENDDIPILPPSGGPTLKRSTRTQYRKGSLRNQPRHGRRAGIRSPDKDDGESTSGRSAAATPPVPSIPEDTLSRIRTEPTPGYPNDQHDAALDRDRNEQALHGSSSMEDIRNENNDRQSWEPDRPQQRPFHSRIASNGRTTAQVPGYSGPAAKAAVPEIIQTPPDSRHSLPAVQLPERKSSHEFSRSNSLPGNAKGAASRPAFSEKQKPKNPSQSLDDMANHSSAHAMGTNTSTDALSFVPTMQEEPKADKQSKKSKSSKDLNQSGSRKGSWGWFRGGGSDDRKKEEKEEEKAAKKSKNKAAKASEKQHDSTRLDVLQTVTEGPRGRESGVFSRDEASSRLDEERKKDSARRSGGVEGKKEKEGLLSSIFGGKKKGDRDSGGRKGDKIRGLSPEPPRRILHADIDYNWTRFSILEERAIYRMAHIKLANPRRALYSQVLLSNFMYSYLAKVQQMHPQIQIPAYVQQKNGNSQQQQSQQKESEEMLQWQRYQEVSLRLLLK